LSKHMIDEVRTLQTLEQVMNWAFGRKPPGELVTVVTQDEFTHDVVIKAASNLWLVFDTN
jgi:hypothetical protein